MKFLETERFFLSLLTEQHAQGVYPEWLNDETVCQGNSHHVFPYSRKGALEYISGLDGRRDCLVLAVEGKEDGAHVGNVSLNRIDLICRSAEFSILLGGSAPPGAGFEVATCIFCHGFKALNLHRIYCGTFDNNHRMIRLAQKLGMREEGVRRQAAFKSGEWRDVVEFGLLRDEYWKEGKE
ncbi:GNAT family protein [Crenobacter sp. SG2303]|uniref:GNAT family protein n=1 Tax=Crenobacter oryzisoli TaxID=3056844 RepID=A0ABT7XQ58_9NEIS|nr:GNAT family protein [Crenobacter sp. SG2303]MDN0075833.1 GNAT family protein [Crenobacter sp. SG2303]